jgi:hypothetical protein
MFHVESLRYMRVVLIEALPCKNSTPLLLLAAVYFGSTVPCLQDKRSDHCFRLRTNHMTFYQPAAGPSSSTSKYPTVSDCCRRSKVLERRGVCLLPAKLVLMLSLLGRKIYYSGMTSIETTSC